MDNIITFTPAELVSGVLGICGLITSIAAVVAIIVAGVKKAKAPTELQDKRIEEIEKRLDRHDDLFVKDLQRFTRLEDGNRYIQRSILALLSSTIDGDHIEEVKRARDELQDYLINSN